MRREVKRSRSGEEPPSGVALRVIHPVAWNIALDRRGQLETLPGVRGGGDAVAHGEHKPAAAPGNNRAYLLADGKRPQLHPGPVITEDHTCGQVDEQQRPSPLVPMRRLTHIGMQVGKYLDPHTRRAGHVLPRLEKLNNPGCPDLGAFSITGSEGKLLSRSGW